MLTAGRQTRFAWQALCLFVFGSVAIVVLEIAEQQSLIEELSATSKRVSMRISDSGVGMGDDAQAVLIAPASIKSLDGAKGSHPDITTKTWTLPVGKYELRATFKSPARQLKLPTVNIEIAEEPILATALGSPPKEKPVPQRTRGTVAGVVTNAATGKSVPGAYVAIDHSGDAGGSNLGRFREQGIYVTGETGVDGRFTLAGVAFSDKHPFLVTCPGYVRHEQSVAVSKAESEARVDVRLKPGATVEVTAIGNDQRPLGGETWIRLESKAGPIFVPPREDWPRTTMRTEKVKDGRARFGELPAGEYSVDVMRIGPSDDELRAMMCGKSREEIQATLSTIPREITYHSGTKSISVRAAENRELGMSPLGHSSEITIGITKDPYAVKDQAFVMLAISRDPGRLLWIGRQFFHPEDHRLGRILRDDFLRTMLVPGQSCRLRNFPPGDYAAFVGTMGLYPNFKSPAFFARAAKLEVRNDLTKTVTIPWTDPEGPSFVSPRALLALDAIVQIESRAYSVAELCSVLTATTDSRAKFQAAPSLEAQSVTLDAGELSVWQLLERLYLHRGWQIEASGDSLIVTTPTRPPTTAPGED